MQLFKDKQIVVLGAGLEGLSSARYLKSQGARVTVADQKTPEQLDPNLKEQLDQLAVTTNLSEDYLNNLSEFEVIVRSPGIRPDLDQIQAAVEKGATLTSNTKIFFENSPAKIIGVTGTKGKGTTATLITEILNRAGKKSVLGGNIGTPALDLLYGITSNYIVVLELSSFQLIDLTKSPHIAVVLMVTSEHLDWHTNVTEYKEAKQNIVKNQNPADFAVVNIDHPVSREFLEIGNGQKIQVSVKEKLATGIYLDDDDGAAVYRNLNGKIEKVIEVSEVGLVGAHNLENVVAAVGVATALETPVEPITQAVREFKGLEHRLEFVREVNGVKYYNDTFSTTPETAIAAIQSFTQPEVVILGGSDKGSDYTELGQTIVNSTNIKSIILIGQMAGNIKAAIQKAGEFKGEFKEGAKDMAGIMEQVKSLTTTGDVVLLSPACASFGMFKNYKERGNQFKDAVSKL